MVLASPADRQGPLPVETFPVGRHWQESSASYAASPSQLSWMSGINSVKAAGVGR